MQYQVLVQNLPDGLFSAFVIGVPDVVAEGATVEEALNNAKTLLRKRLATGRLFTIEVEEAPRENRKCVRHRRCDGTS
jgi:predicted RNase H-like HicB family nuclease